MGWIKTPAPFIDPACASLGALRVRFRATRYTQDDTEGGADPYRCGVDLFERVVGAPTPTDVKGKTEEILLTIVGEDIILPQKNAHRKQSVFR